MMRAYGFRSRVVGRSFSILGNRSTSTDCFLFANASFGMCRKRSAPLGMHRKLHIFRSLFRTQTLSFHSRLWSVFTPDLRFDVADVDADSRALVFYPCAHQPNSPLAPCATWQTSVTISAASAKLHLSSFHPTKPLLTSRGGFMTMAGLSMDVKPRILFSPKYAIS